MASPEVQAFAYEQFPILHDLIYAAMGEHPDSVSVPALKTALDTFYTEAVSILGVSVVQQRDGGHKPPPEDPEDVP